MSQVDKETVDGPKWEVPEGYRCHPGVVWDGESGTLPTRAPSPVQGSVLILL